MRRHYGETRAQREANWKARFSDAVVTLEPKYSGRIEWDSATFFYNQGMEPQEAAKRYVKNREQRDA
jgi:hypothetical protein